ncbi:MAG: alpha/beta fold hydrolase [Legionellales bacterium]|nr:alpha/beta fold hydrolase [Legionellales bacterium]
MHTLYPAIKPYACHELAVTKPHNLYIEETGNPNGMPVMVLHPGPGAGGDSHLRRFFDPQAYRIVIFDQRGCGRSTPHASILHNQTEDILEDIEAVRDLLKIDRFVLFGGGWGAPVCPKISTTDQRIIITSSLFRKKTRHRLVLQMRCKSHLS